MKNELPPLAVEPLDREWGVGVSGLTKEPSPFPRINRMLAWVNNLDSTADDQRARIVTECYDKYAAYAPALRWALTLRELYEKVDIHIWPEELIVGELAAKPNSAPLYPEFSVDWLADEFLYRPMEERTNDRYVISEEVKRTVFDLLLPYLVTDTPITKEHLAALGHGGLCLNCKVCHFPNCGFGKGV